MRRQDIQLLAQARQGDARAHCELGRRYLVGTEGIARHVGMAVEHLAHPSLAGDALAACTLVEHLPLHELLALQLSGPWPAQLQRVLAMAAGAGSARAQLRHGAWLCTQPEAWAEGCRWIERAASGGHAVGKSALAAVQGLPPRRGLIALLRALGDGQEVDALALAELAAREALRQRDLPRLQQALATAWALSAADVSLLSSLVAAAVQLAEAQGQALHEVPAEAQRRALEFCAIRGDPLAAYALGRGLCGIAMLGLTPEAFAEHQNMRKGAAFLLRAADAGCDAAWLHLYHLHADHALSIANPQMARFFLEKAAQRGQAEAQRKLGALMLRESASLAESEQAIHWLYQASGQGDGHAAQLLKSLVLPVGGAADDAELGGEQPSEQDADWAIDQVRSTDPWLAARLSLARSFGLTKLEALSVDPVDGLRPWGLVVGRNPFIVQAKLSAPRAVPALNGRALQAAQQAAALYAQSGGDRPGAEGDLRSRSLRQRRLFDRLGLDEALFFADASATTLEALRLGAKWAYRARQPLSAALAS